MRIARATEELVGSTEREGEINDEETIYFTEVRASFLTSNLSSKLPVMLIMWVVQMYHGKKKYTLVNIHSSQQDMAPPSLWPSETTNLLLYLYAVFQVQCSPLLAGKGPHCFLDGALHEAPLSHLPGRAIIDSAAQSIIFPPCSQESRAAAQRWRWSYGLYRLKANELSALADMKLYFIPPKQNWDLWF